MVKQIAAKARPALVAASTSTFMPLTVRAEEAAPLGVPGAAVTVVVSSEVRIEVAELDATSAAWVVTLVKSLGRWGRDPLAAQRACGRHRARGRPRRIGTFVPLLRAPRMRLGAPVDPCRRPRGVSAPQAEAQRRDAPRDDAGAISVATGELDSAVSFSIAALVGGVRAALAAARGGGPARAGESWGDAEVAARQEEEADREDARRRVAVRRERRGALPERGRDSEKAVRSRPRTSLGDGVVKPGGSWIAWAQLLRRIDWVDVLACRCSGRRAYVADISDSEVVVALLAHLGCLRLRHRSRGRGVPASILHEGQRLEQRPKAQRRREGGGVSRGRCARGSGAR